MTTAATKTTRTTLLIEPHKIEFATQGPQTPAPGEVLIQVSAVGVCGSDVHWYLDGQIGESKLTAPLTLGHEPAGLVLGVGEGVNPELVGKRVAIEPAVHCGKCRWCLRGDTNICPHIKFMGTPPIHGAFREQLCHPAHLVAPLPDGMSDEMGALLEPLAIAVHAIDLIRPRADSSIIIQGAGPIGLCCLLGLKNYAPHPLIVVEPIEYRREFAKQLGATHVFSSDDPNLISEVRKLTGGYGADTVVEACGTRESFGQMVHLAAPGAKLAVIGIEPHDNFGFAHSPARRKGLTLYMVRRSRHTLERAIELTQAGWWQPEALITHRRTLGELPATMDMVAQRADGVIKAIIEPQK